MIIANRSAPRIMVFIVSIFPPEPSAHVIRAENPLLSKNLSADNS
jgi:hypothetical protein